jgi:hypothetical protein
MLLSAGLESKVSSNTVKRVSLCYCFFALNKLSFSFLRTQQIELSAAVPRRTVGLLAMRGPMGLTTPTTFVSRGPVGAKEARVVVSISVGEPLPWEPYRLKPDIILLALKSQSRSNHLSILVWGNFKDSFVLHFS